MTNPCDSNSTVSINSAILSGALPGVAGPAGPISYPETVETFVINAPAPGRYYLTYSNTASTITKVVTMCEGATPSVEWNMDHGSNYTGIGTSLFASDVTSTNTTIGNVYPDNQVFAVGGDDVNASSHIWLDITTVAAGTDTFIVNVIRNVTPSDTLSDKGIRVEDTGTTAGYIPIIDTA